MKDEEKVKFESFVMGRANEINSKYAGVISDKKIDELIQACYALNLGYEDAKSKVDSELSKVVKDTSDPDDSKNKFINLMNDNYNEQHNVDNPDSFLGIVVDLQLIELLNEFKKTDDLDFSLEGQMLYFTRSRDSLLAKYKENNISYPLSFENITFENTKKLYDFVTKNFNVLSIDFNMNDLIKDDVNIFNKDESINSYCFNFDRVSPILEFARDNKKKVKIKGIFDGEIFPKQLDVYLTDSGLNSRRRLALSFIDSYVSNIASLCHKIGCEVVQIDAIDNVINEKDENVLYKKSLWNNYLGKNDKGDLYFIDFCKCLDKYFPDAYLLLNEDNEFLKNKCNKIVECIKYIQGIEKRDNIKLINGIGLKSHYFDWSQDLDMVLDVSDVYDSMYQLFKLGLPLFRTEYGFRYTTNDPDTKKNLLDAIHLTDQYCCISGIIFGSYLDLINENNKGDYKYYLDGYEEEKMDKETKEDELGKTVFLKLMDDDEPPSGFILSNGLLVFVILVFAFIVIVASILLN